MTKGHRALAMFGPLAVVVMAVIAVHPMTASARQNQTEPAPAIGKSRTTKPSDAGRRNATQPDVYATDDDGAQMNWPRRAPGRAQGRRVERQWQQDLQPTEYIEGRTLKWIKQLEQLADLALRPQGDLRPDYNLAAKTLIGLPKLSSVGRQRLDLTARIAMSAGPDLSQLSDQELKAIELGSPEQLNELAWSIGRFKSPNQPRGAIGRGQKSRG